MHLTLYSQWMNSITKRKQKKLNSSTSISLPKAYLHLFFHVDRHYCICGQCHVREECLQILLEQKTNRLVLTTSYKLIKMPERNTYPFHEEWKIKKQFVILCKSSIFSNEFFIKFLS